MERNIHILQEAFQGYCIFWQTIKTQLHHAALDEIQNYTLPLHLKA